MFGRFVVATKNKLGPHQLCSSIGRTADLIGPKLIRRVLFSCYIFLAIVHHGPQAQDKSCSRGLVMTWFLPRPWPAFHGQLGPGVGLFIRLGVGYARVVWDVRGWYGMYSRLDFSGYVRKYALCRRGMVAGRSPPYLRLRVHKKSLAFKEIRPERRGVVAGRSLPYLRFRARKRNNVDDVHETPRSQNIANTLVFLMFPVTPCKRSTSPWD